MAWAAPVGCVAHSPLPLCCGDQAREMSASASDEATRRRFAEIAACIEHSPAKPPRTFREALQARPPPRPLVPPLLAPLLSAMPRWPGEVH